MELKPCILSNMTAALWIIYMCFTSAESGKCYIMYYTSAVTSEENFHVQLDF